MSGSTNQQLTVRQVDGWRGVGRFVDVAWKVQARGPSGWIPPLRLTVRDGLSKRNPFYRNAERALFIAERVTHQLSVGLREELEREQRRTRIGSLTGREVEVLVRIADGSDPLRGRQRQLNRPTWPPLSM